MPSRARILTGLAGLRKKKAKPDETQVAPDRGRPKIDKSPGTTQQPQPRKPQPTQDIDRQGRESESEAARIREQNRLRRQAAADRRRR